MAELDVVKTPLYYFAETVGTLIYKVRGKLVIPGPDNSASPDRSDTNLQSAFFLLA